MIGVAERTVVNAAGESRLDAVIVEEPLEIIVFFGSNFKPQRAVHTVTMRTPGHDGELAAGILLSDGVITSRSNFMGPVPHGDNEVRIALRPEINYERERYRRTGYSSSACGLCGTLEIDRLTEKIETITSTMTIAAETVSPLPMITREHQTLFRQTGGCHAAARFDRLGHFQWLYEDVGRHNALDKLIGYSVLNCESIGDSIVVLSGRAGFEMVQKAAVAQVPILISVGAPTSLAVALAEKVGMTLIGFVRKADFNIYSHPHRVTR